jgi:hypothetical protein
MSVIDITMVVDALSVVRDNPVSSPSAHTMLKNAGKGYFFTLTYWNDVNAGVMYTDQDENQGGFCLEIKANMGDTIRWRMTSLSVGFGYQCFIQSFYITSGPPVMAPMQPKAEIVPCAIQAADGSVSVEQVHDYYWETTITGQGNAGYDVFFSIYDSTGGHIGIFTCDPRIDVPGLSRYSMS